MKWYRYCHRTLESSNTRLFFKLLRKRKRRWVKTWAINVLNLRNQNESLNHLHITNNKIWLQQKSYPGSPSRNSAYVYCSEYASAYSMLHTQSVAAKIRATAQFVSISVIKPLLLILLTHITVWDNKAFAEKAFWFRAHRCKISLYSSFLLKSGISLFRMSG